MISFRRGSWSPGRSFFPLWRGHIRATALSSSRVAFPHRLYRYGTRALRPTHRLRRKRNRGRSRASRYIAATWRLRTLLSLFRADSGGRSRALRVRRILSKDMPKNLQPRNFVRRTGCSLRRSYIHFLRYIRNLSCILIRCYAFSGTFRDF